MSLQERIARGLEGIEFSEVEVADGMTCLEVSKEHLRPLMIALRDRLGFESNTLVTAVDNYPAQPRFRIIYQFLSIQHNDRIRVHTSTTGENPTVPTISDYWPGAAFSERECFDMFGIQCEGDEGLKRLLMPEAYEHFPLRKDFPHQGIEPDKLYREWDARRRIEKEVQ